MTDPIISFSVKDVLTEIKVAIKDLDTKLDTKADKGDMVDLVSRLRTLELDHNNAVATTTYRNSLISNRKWLVGAIGMFVGSGGTYLVHAALTGRP